MFRRSAARTSSLALFGALLTTAPPAAAQQSAADLKPVTTVEGITEYRLDNGLEVLLFPDASKPQVTVNITYFVGSRMEGYGETGMAHLLEHMLFKGTPGHPDIPKSLNDRGAVFNGTTWYDRTNYFEVLPATDDNLAWALGLEADRMVNSTVSAKDLASEMTVVRNEMESGENDPGNILQERVMSTAYLWHNYGNSTIGARSDVEDVPIQRLQAFYHKYYQPDNSMLVIAGNFDPAKALDLVVKDFASIPRPDRSGAEHIWPTYTREPTQDGERTVTLRRTGDVQMAMTLYHVPSGSDPSFAALDVLAYALGDSPSGRLYKALVEPKLATDVAAYAYQLKQPSPFFVQATVRKDGDLARVREVLDSTVMGVLRRPVTEQEVARAKAAILKSLQLAFNNSTQIAIQLSEWASMGDWRLFFLYRDDVAKVTAADVNRVAHDYLKRSNRTVGLFYPTAHPDRAEIPPVPNVDSLVHGYKGREVVAQGEAFDPSPANIDARTRTFTLANGMKVALLPKQTRGRSAIVRLRLAFGDSASLQGRVTAGEEAGSMLMRGTREHSRQQIQDLLDSLKAQGSVGGGANIGSGQFQTVRASLPGVIRLMAELVREPAFPDSEFQTLKQQQLASIEQSSSEPMARAQIALARHMEPWSAGTPDYTPTSEESLAAIKGVTLDQVRAFHHDFYGPQDGNIVVVGDFDPDSIRAVLEQTFGDWKSPHPYHRIAQPFYDPPAVDTTIETPDKANAVFLAEQNLKLSDTDPDYPALALAGYMIGGGELSSRLADRIRQKDGLSYAVGAVISGHPVDPSGRFYALAISAPQNTAKVEADFKDEIRKVLDQGFTDDEVASAKKAYLQSRKLQRAQDGSLAATLSSNLYFGRTFAFDADLEKKIEALTTDEINAAVRKRLDLSKITIVKAGDFASLGHGGGRP